jgi:hypothetical protein
MSYKGEGKMLDNITAISNALSSSVRELNGKVEHYNNSTLQNTFSKNTSLQKVEI